MRAFVRVVEAGSFTKAAETLDMSKTTVTHLVQQLEARLCVKLLHRTTRRIKVTPDGIAYYGRTTPRRACRAHLRCRAAAFASTCQVLSLG